ncbi:MAG: peptide deformylase [Bifidobacteriaceae bacterium]|jgi:peptide deformylase|nr:peptide deformylase [Bifidobacteriaceae bacterium]MCI1914530.1 peptide deformylase [Bifidobacteriaceae bacterium]
MQRPIMTSPAFLSQKSSAATQRDIPTAVDLADTLAAHSDRCVGMAANMIGVSKRIIVFKDETQNDRTATMFNPTIREKFGQYEAEEECLSLTGSRTVMRFRRISVEYQDEKFRTHTQTYTGWTAQIIQHEVDHCDGILV